MHMFRPEMHYIILTAQKEKVVIDKMHDLILCCLTKINFSPLLYTNTDSFLCICHAIKT